MLLILTIRGLSVDFNLTTVPVFKLYAVPHKEVALHSPVFSLPEVEYFLYVRVPASITRTYELYQVSEIRDTAEVLCDKDLWEHDPCRIWYRFRTEKLNLNAGFHMYRLSFVDVFHNDTCSLYISYTLQTNNPDKPYDYMSKRGEECNCNG